MLNLMILLKNSKNISYREGVAHRNLFCSTDEGLDTIYLALDI